MNIRIKCNLCILPATDTIDTYCNKKYYKMQQQTYQGGCLDKQGHVRKLDTALAQVGLEALTK